MENKNIESIPSCEDSYFDCRSLGLRCEFYQLPRINMTELAIDIYEWLRGIYAGTFIVEFAFNARHLNSISQFVAKLGSSVDNSEMWNFSTEGFVRCSMLDNNIRTALKKTKLMRTNSGSLPSSPSIDYKNFWENKFPHGRCENDELIHNINSFFCEPSRFYIGHVYIPDVESILVANTYKNNKDLYYASFSFDIRKACIERKIDLFANSFAEFLKYLSSKYVNVNGRVMLQPINFLGDSPHMRYFSKNLVTDESHLEAGCTEKEWYRTYYVCGAEWCNVISPLARSHLSQPETQIKHSGELKIGNLAGGGLLVASNKDISSVDVEDLRPIKQILYDALYPGSWSISIRDMFRLASKGSYLLCPRNNWCIVPMMEGEIEIESTYLVYRKKIRK